MAANTIKLTQANSNNVLTDMKNNVGTTRTDEYYFAAAEINIKDLRDVAFKKNVIIAIAQVDEYVSKMTFVAFLT